MGGHFSSPGPLQPAQNAYRQAVDDKVMALMADYGEGKWSPFIIAVDTIPISLMFGTLFCLHYLSPGLARSVRYISFTLITVLSLWIMANVQTLSLAYGYGTGLVFSVAIVNSATMFIWNDPTGAFKRLEQKVDGTNPSLPTLPPTENGSTAKTSSTGAQTANGIAVERKQVIDQTARHETLSKRQGAAHSMEKPVGYFWQSYPANFLHRLDWSLHLLISFRGPAWNFRPRTLGPLSKDPSSEFPKPALNDSRKAFVKNTLRNFTIFYLWLDLLKVVFMYDPYFLGKIPLDSAPPQAFSRYFPILTAYPILTRVYRLTLSCMGILVALNAIFTLFPILGGIILPHTLFRHNTHYVPLSHPILYPPIQNSFVSVLDHGLSGWWGDWWHQMFRFGISEPSRVAIDALGWTPKSQRARVLQVLVAFTITAFFHAMGSLTTYGPSHPVSGPSLFFVLQGVGLLAQNYVTKTLLGPYIRRLPRWQRRAGNLLFILVWFYYTGPLFADDAAAAGLWYFEPVPISPLRGLGLGLKGEGWWCWHGKWIIWWEGREGDIMWWRRGWAII